ncbi:MAG: PAS domain S-box protein [Bacteroidetes bacterium]|nr:PAS domain S-box protein [Bacteroidota bacterium]MBU2585513.1 PAS domain S-box protein [Bacteroidota bacterium]
MNKIISKFSLSTKVIVTFSVFVLILIVLTIINVSNIGRFEENNYIVNHHTIPKLIALEEISNNLGLIEVLVNRHVLTSNLERMNEYESSIRKAISENANKIKHYKNLIKNPEESYLFTEFLSQRKKFLDLTEDRIQINRQNLDKKAKEFIKTKNFPEYEQYLKSITNLFNYAINESSISVESTNEFISDTKLLRNILIIAGILFTIVMGFVIVSVSNQLKLENEKLKKEIHERSLIENRYQTLAEAAQDMIFIFGLDGQIEYVNNYAAKQFDKQPGELIGKTIGSLFPKDVAEIHRSNILAVFETKKPLYSETLANFLGRDVWLHSSLVPLFDQNNQITSVLIISRDISDRKKSEESLLNAEQKLREIIDHSTNLFFTRTIDHVFTYVSPQSRNFFECEPEEVMINWQEFLTNNPHNSIGIELTQKAIDTGIAQPPYELELKTLKGRIVWVEANEAPVVVNGKTKAIVGSFTDITDRKRAEEKLFHRLQLEKLIAHISTQFINVEDQNIDVVINYAIKQIGLFTNSDRSYLFLFNHDISKMNNTHEWCADGVEPQIDNLKNLPADVFPWWYKKLSSNESIVVQRVSELPPHASTEKKILEMQDIKSVAAVPMFMKNKLYGFLGFDAVKQEKVWAEEDVALLKLTAEILASALERERKEKELIRAKEKAEEANRLKSGFLSAMSHEIRTPLNIISGYASILKELFSVIENEEVQNHLYSIERSSERLLDSINAILVISQFEAKEFKVNLVPLSINSIIGLAYNEMSTFAANKNINMEIELPDKILMVLGDEYCLNGVILNLLSNSIKYSNKGTISVVLTENSGFAVCTVEDEGIGMSDKYQKHLFETFSQEDVGINKQYEGCGLGLALTKKYIGALNGEIEFKSEKGIGTKVTFKIPLA